MKIDFEDTPLPGVVLVRPTVFEDERGSFSEVFRSDSYSRAGLPGSFVQWNRSRSARNVTRGLHFQWDPPMGKLQTVTSGSAFLVAVDIRRDSPTLGRWFGIELSAADRVLLWAPAGFARGFAVTTEWAEIDYLCTGVYNPTQESGIRWDDPEIGIAWPVTTPILSKKDSEAQPLRLWLERHESHKFSMKES